MSFPTVTVEIAFATDPGAAPTWTDVTAWLDALSISRQSDQGDGPAQAGTAQVRLDNYDRRFDPTNAAGPYYPNVRPLRRMRISATFGGTTYRLFTGFIEAWPLTPENAVEGFVTVSAVDGFKVLAMYQVAATFAAQRSDVRVAAVLDAAGWPAADRALAVGQSTVVGVTLAGVAALGHLQDVAASENGRLFVRGDGALVFQSRHGAITAPYTTSQATFGEAGSELHYLKGLAPSFDDRAIYNDVRVTPTGGAQQVASDATSRTRYLSRTLSRDLLVSSELEALDAANWLLARYKEPVLRFDAISIDPTTDDLLWPQALGRDMGDRITVRHRPAGGGALLEQPSIITGIEHAAANGPQQWQTTWTLSAADVYSYWLLGDATYGVLGVTTRLAY